jgi:hypothetical protein
MWQRIKGKKQNAIIEIVCWVSKMSMKHSICNAIFRVSNDIFNETFTIPKGIFSVLVMLL